MKTKTIKKILRAKLKAFANSIDDKRLSSEVMNNTIVTGGAIVSLLLNEEPNDFDLYFKDVAFAKEIAAYYVETFSKYTRIDGIVDDEGGGRVLINVRSSGVFQTAYPLKDEGEYIPVFISDNAISLTDKIQLVLRFVGPAEVIHRNYDFVHCKGYYDAATDSLVLPQEVLESILTKELRYVGSKYPLCSLARLRKFIQRGWTINAGQILKICFQVSELDLKNVDVLRDQLIGVDTMYFIEFIKALESKDPSIDLNQSYIFQLIDEIFDNDLPEYGESEENY